MSKACPAAAPLSASAVVPTESPRSTPMPSWQYTVRNLLAHLPKTVLLDSQISDLRITFIEDEDEPSTRLSTETILAIDTHLASSRCYWSYNFLERIFRDMLQEVRPGNGTFFGKYLASNFSLSIENLGDQHSENRVRFERECKTLRITGDTRTKGVKTALNAWDMQNGRSISILIRNRQNHEWKLDSAELYTLLALADEQRLGNPSASSFEVHLMVVRSHWIQRLSVQVPSSFLTSIIEWKGELLGNLKIRRTPWFNFMEEQGRRSALQAVFEHFPLKTACTVPPWVRGVPAPLPPFLTGKRKLGDTEIRRSRKRRPRLKRSDTTATSSARSRDIQVTSVERRPA